MPRNDTEQNKALMLEALEASLGIVTTAAKKVGIHRKTHYDWMRTDEAYRMAVRDIDDVAVDFAESQLHRLIKEGNPAANIFFLKTKGKHRGYIERTETEHIGEPQVVHVIYEDVLDEPDED